MVLVCNAHLRGRDAERTVLPLALALALAQALALALALALFFTRGACASPVGGGGSFRPRGAAKGGPRAQCLVLELGSVLGL